MKPNACPTQVWRKKTNNLGDWFTQARRQLEAKSEQPSLEIQVLASGILQKPRSWVQAHPEYPLSNETEKELNALLERLGNGEPLAYLLGRWEFYGREFEITPDVLIPRPETELLVEKALYWLKHHPGQRSAADIGTGSGCIAVSLAAHQSDIQVFAVDISMKALRIAQHNCHKHQVSSRVHLVQADLLQPFNGRFDLVCANLPYIPTATLMGLAVHRFEPELALDGGLDGLQYIQPLLISLASKLAAGGAAFLEIEAGQGESVPGIAHQYLPDAAIYLFKDCAGNHRIVHIQIPDPIP